MWWMDEEQLFNLINKCKHLKHKFVGVFASDNFPPLMNNSAFIIVNASPGNTIGTHWLLLCNRNNTIIFGDPLGFSLTQYQSLYKRCTQFYDTVHDLMTSVQLQPSDSNDCGLYCVYLAHVVFKLNSSIPLIGNNQLHRFVNHMIWLLTFFFNLLF